MPLALLEQVGHVLAEPDTYFLWSFINHSEGALTNRLGREACLNGKPIVCECYLVDSFDRKHAEALGSVRVSRQVQAVLVEQQGVGIDRVGDRLIGRWLLIVQH